MSVSAAAGGWQAFYTDWQERMNAAGDEGLKAHFAAELEIAQQTMKAMGLEAPPAETHPAETAPPAAKPDDLQPAGDFALTGKMAEYEDEILEASEATGVPPELIAAVVWDESKGDPNAGTVNGENGMADSGLMQVNSETYAALKEQFPDLLGGEPGSIQDNIMAGALYLAQQHAQFGDWDLALRAYNSGPGSVDPSDASISTTGFGTANYVEKVNYFEELISRGQVLPDGYPGGNEMY